LVQLPLKHPALNLQGGLPAVGIGCGEFPAAQQAYASALESEGGRAGWTVRRKPDVPHWIVLAALRRESENDMLLFIGGARAMVQGREPSVAEVAAMEVCRATLMDDIGSFVVRMRITDSIHHGAAGTVDITHRMLFARRTNAECFTVHERHLHEIQIEIAQDYSLADRIDVFCRFFGTLGTLGAR
jgi:hypothetical protein